MNFLHLTIQKLTLFQSLSYNAAILFKVFMTIFKRSSAHQWERKSLFMAEQTKLRRLYTDSTLTPHDQVVNEHCKCTQQGSNEPKKILVSCTQILWSKFTTLQLIAKVVIVISIMYQHNVFKLQSLFLKQDLTSYPRPIFITIVSI